MAGLRRVDEGFVEIVVQVAPLQPGLHPMVVAVAELEHGAQAGLEALVFLLQAADVVGFEAQFLPAGHGIGCHVAVVPDLVAQVDAQVADVDILALGQIGFG